MVHHGCAFREHSLGCVAVAVDSAMQSCRVTYREPVLHIGEAEGGEQLEAVLLQIA